MCNEILYANGQIKDGYANHNRILTSGTVFFYSP